MGFSQAIAFDDAAFREVWTRKDGQAMHHGPKSPHRSS